MPHESYAAKLRDKIATTQKKYLEAVESVEQVRILLSKADARRLNEPDDARKWHRVLNNLEISLDESKKRVQLFALEIQRTEGELEKLSRLSPEEDADFTETLPSESSAESDWDVKVHQVKAMSLEESALLQEQIDSGEVCDKQLEASLELANQIGEEKPAEVDGDNTRRQIALRAAIDKIRKSRIDTMTYEEIKLVLACRTLLTSRLEPKDRDQRLKRIIDGASRVLQRRKIALEGGQTPKFKI